jgi:serine/threonine protein kinase
MKPLRIVEAEIHGQQAMYTLPIRPFPVDNNYTPIFEVTLGHNDPVLVAEKKGISSGIVEIRYFQTLGSQQIEMLRTIQHQNIVKTYELFRNQNEAYVVFEHMLRSLAEVVGNPVLSNTSVAAIIGQVRYNHREKVFV